MHHLTKFLGGVLLVSGTTIGAAMLVLPVSTGAAGYFPSLALFAAFWIFMSFTALLFLEINTWTGQRTNLITMAKTTLGTPGTIVCWSAYLFLLYALMTAYIAGSGNVLCNLVSSATGIGGISSFLCAAPLVILFSVFLVHGTSHIDYLNRLFMIGLIATYFLIVFMLAPSVETSKLEYRDWPYLFSGLSVVATSFGFHIIIPSLYSYLHADIKLLKWTLLIGSFIPLLVYIVWQTLVLGIIPLDGPHGILEGNLNAQDGAILLAKSLQSPGLALMAQLFSFFAIFTSFIGVVLSLSDFLADGLKIKKDYKGNATLILLTFVPPFILAFSHPRAFISALEAAGAFGVVFLLGLLPAVMVWSGRYFQHRDSHYKAPGGKIALILTILFSLAAIGVEIFNKLGWVPHA